MTKTDRKEMKQHARLAAEARRVYQQTGSGVVLLLFQHHLNAARHLSLKRRAQERRRAA